MTNLTPGSTFHARSIGRRGRVVSYTVLSILANGVVYARSEGGKERAFQPWELENNG